MMPIQSFPTKFKVYIHHPFSRMPIKQHPNDAGYDIHSCEWMSVPAKQWRAIKTGIHFDIPEGWEIQIRPRSGLALKKGITIMNTPATIDEGYTGEIVVILHNTGDFPFDIAPGDRIAQLIMQPVYNTVLEEMDSPPIKFIRGNNGLGSTGVGCICENLPQ